MLSGRLHGSTLFHINVDDYLGVELHRRIELQEYKRCKGTLHRGMRIVKIYS